MEINPKHWLVINMALKNYRERCTQHMEGAQQLLNSTNEQNRETGERCATYWQDTIDQIDAALADLR